MTNQPSEKKQINPFAKLLMYLFAVPSVAVVESTKALFRKTYSRNDSPIPLLIGALVALASGIGAGYQTGWVLEFSTMYWLGWGIVTTAATFLYLWPLLYLSIFNWAFRLSESLWKHVNIEGESYSYGRSENRPPAWFSRVLIFLGYAASVLTALFVAYSVDVYIQAHQGGWWWLGAILGIIAAIVVVVVIVSILGLAREFSGGLAVFLFLVMAGLTWWFWGFLAGLAVGIWGSLSGSDWGNWGYVAGAIPALISAIAVGAALCALVHWLKVRLIAFATGLATVWVLTPHINAAVGSLTEGLNLGPLSVVTPAFPWAAAALVLLLFVGFLYPLVHIIVSHVGRRLANYLDLLEEVYGDDTRYRGFFAQLTTFGIGGCVLWYAPAFVASLLGLTALWSIWSVTAALAILSYLVFGGLLRWTGSWPAGVATSLAAGYVAFSLSTYSTAMSLAIGAGAALGTFFLVFPIAYLVLRLILDPLLASWLAEPLMKLHKHCLSAIGELFDSLTEAAERTYSDNTPYKPTFLHLINLVVAGGVAYGGWLLTNAVLDFASWLAVSSVVLATALSYLLIGKLLQVVGNWTVGVLVGAFGGLVIGTFAHAAQAYGFWVSVPVGLIGAALTFGLIFPVTYLVLRAIINVTQPQAWLKPLLETPHNWCWKRFTSVWGDFKKAYREVRDAWKPIWENFQATYAEVSTSVKQMLNRN